ncbi:Abi family protein [Zunongwangia endophytica]|uniref:Abi family protein n=1 Tax=Zunongwangia endophytica TaxID=1808945 RepID=A0ABV8H3V9_9FLAO|nr:Abi family protein [Zunongwangia endophytica]MDN3595986.1 Abi family protein [Zunongwangia endophytica]
MGKTATTVDEQIDKLKGRNMTMDLGDVKAKEILLDIGYYRLGFYWNPFEIDEHHNLKNGTKFSDVVKLYYLDTDLKHILSRALNRIEINFKTQLIYYVSNYYDKNPTWFADKKIVSHQFVKGFPKIYTESFKKNNKPIKNHHRKHSNDIYAPAWKTLEYLTFGSVIKLYLSLHNQDLQKKIAEQYGIKSLGVFENYLTTILFIRNICAHSDLLFDSYTPLGIKSTPIIDIDRNKRHSLSSSIRIICYFLEKISVNRCKEITKNINDLFAQFNDNKAISEIIVNKIGYEL